MGAGRSRNRVGIFHQEINEQHTKQIPLPMDRTYKIIALIFPYLLEIYLPSPFTDVSNVFTVNHIDLSRHAGWSGSGWNCLHLVQYLTDILTISHHIELVL